MTAFCPLAWVFTGHLCHRLYQYFAPSWWLNSISLRIGAVCVPTHRSVRIWSVSTFWLLWVTLLWTLWISFCWTCVFNSLGYIRRGEIAGSHGNSNYSRTYQIVSKEALYFPYSPTTSVGEPQFLCFFTSPCSCLLFWGVGLLSHMVACLSFWLNPVGVKSFVIVVGLRFPNDSSHSPEPRAYWPSVYLLQKNVYS